MPGIRVVRCDGGTDTHTIRIAPPYNHLAPISKEVTVVRQQSGIVCAVLGRAHLGHGRCGKIW